ncbi:MAG: hypothetical protein AAGH64_08370 [Planctomycetota bacterium]
MLGKYTGVAALGMCVGVAHASVQFANPSFESDAGWITTNDAALAVDGGEAGWTFDTPVQAGGVWESSEGVFPTDGDGFAMTYAGLDQIGQVVTIPRAGTYEISLDWNGVAGVFRNSIGNTTPSGTGAFRLFADLDAGVGDRGNVLLSDSVSAIETPGWETFTWTVVLPAGDVVIGVENTALASYAIAYDNFAIVPAPGALALLGLGACVTRRRRG